MFVDNDELKTENSVRLLRHYNKEFLFGIFGHEVLEVHLECFVE